MKSLHYVPSLVKYFPSQQSQSNSYGSAKMCEFYTCKRQCIFHDFTATYKGKRKEQVALTFVESQEAMHYKSGAEK